MAELRQEVRSLLKQARDLEGVGQPQAAAAMLDQLLALEPHHSDALELKQNIEENRQQQGRLERLVERARSSLETGACQPCLEAAVQGLALDPDHRELRSLYQAAESDLDRARHQEQQTLSNLVEFAQREARLGRVKDASGIAEFALFLVPDHAEATELQLELEGESRSASQVRPLAQASAGSETPPESQHSLRFDLTRLTPRLQAEAARWLASSQAALQKGFRLFKSRLPEWRRFQSSLTEIRQRLGGMRQALPEMEFRKWLLQLRNSMSSVKVGDWSSRKWLQYTGAAVAALVLSLAVPLWLDSAPDVKEPLPQAVVDLAPLPPGAVGLTSTPWARVDSVIRRDDQTPLEGIECTTPCWISLPPGQYELRLSNDRFPDFGSVWLAVETESGERQSHHVELPNFRVNEEIGREISRLRGRAPK